MPNIIPRIDRDQMMITSYNDLVDPESPARVIDYFVDNLDLKEIGIKNAEPSKDGRGSYPADGLLKMYIYGYRKNIRSSRKLAEACNVNLEVIWLMKGLKPDFRTISDFRKDNVSCLKKVFKDFTSRVTVDLDTGAVSVDGSKFKAWNSKDRNFTITKLDDRIKWLEDHSDEYLRLIAIADENDEAETGSLTRDELEDKLKEAQERLEKYKAYREYMIKENLSQISLTDADCKLMKMKNGMDTAYNVQTAVSSETHMVMDYKVTNNCTDHGLLGVTLEGIKKESGDEIVEAIADKGYQQAEDMVGCLEGGIIPNVILPEGQDDYELEIPYEESECDASGTKPEEIKKCLRNGVIPDVYEGIIKDMEIAEVRKKVIDEPAEMAEPYATEEEMRERAREGYYVRDPEQDKVYCPAGAVLRKKSIKRNGDTRYANKTACSKCPYRNKCITGNSRWKELDFNKDTLEKKAKWWVTEPTDPTPDDNGPRKGKKAKWHFETKKVVKFKFIPDRKKMELRKNTSEHPFGTVKRYHDSAYYLLKSKRKVSGETALILMGYNIARAENMFTFEELMERVGRKTA